MSSNGFEQVEESFLALAADGIIHVTGVQGRSRVVRREVASPNDRQVRESRSNLAAACDGTDGLRSGHDRNRQEFHPVAFDQRD